MVASAEARAERRTRELAEKGMPANYEDVLREMKERDAQDSGRAIAPAIPAPDAIHLDNSGMSVEESVQAVIALLAPHMNKL
jgi:cytidylate kinase